MNTRKKSNEKTKKSNEKTNNSDKFKRPLPDLYLRPSLRISTPGTSKFRQNSKFHSEARFGFSAKKAVHSDGYRPKIRSICHVTDIKPDSASPRRSRSVTSFRVGLSAGAESEGKGLWLGAPKEKPLAKKAKEKDFGWPVEPNEDTLNIRRAMMM